MSEFDSPPEVALRPSQDAVINGYRGGLMGVAAVPGSGKTFTLSHLAARLVAELTDFDAAEEREVLVVTLTNSAVNTFRRRIADLLRQERGLLPYVGYRVRTLHGLAHDIVRMRPGLVGLSESFEIVDERVSNQIITDLAERWVRLNGDRLIPYLGGDLGLSEDPGGLSYSIRRHAPELVDSIARETIRIAKDNGWEPEEMVRRIEAAGEGFLLAQIGVSLYVDYQRALRYRGAVDFDDLVRLAMLAFDSDPAFLARLQERWPYILEDEAQDSSLIQDRMLRLLAGADNEARGLPQRALNWARVGDPNQAIFTTFTTADSNILRAFLNEPGVVTRELPVAGRSAQPVIDLANYLIRWTRSGAGIEHLRETFREQVIQPTPPGDPQQNPSEGTIFIDWDPEKNITPEAEITRVAGSLARFVPANPKSTVAVLVPENSRGFKVAEELKDREIPYEELLRSTSATRDAAARLQVVFDFLADPTSSRALAQLFTDVWWPRFVAAEGEQAFAVRDAIGRALRDLRAVEDLPWPGPGGPWIPEVEGLDEEALRGYLEPFAARLREWLYAASLPVDQLVLTVAADLFTGQPDLALAHKIALVLRGIAETNEDYRLPELARELRMIAENERRFLGFDDAVTGYEPRKGVVTVATMHAAKGLEWDRVYLLAVNNYSFPTVQPGDSYLAEKWFIRDELNIQAEAHRQFELAMSGQADRYVEGEASRAARLDYAQERLRLLYVGITRARRDLSLHWNMGRFWDQGRRNVASQALIALYHYWKEHKQ